MLPGNARIKATPNREDAWISVARIEYPRRRLVTTTPIAMTTTITMFGLMCGWRGGYASTSSSVRTWAEVGFTLPPTPSGLSGLAASISLHPLWGRVYPSPYPLPGPSTEGSAENLGLPIPLPSLFWTLLLPHSFIA